MLLILLFVALSLNPRSAVITQAATFTDCENPSHQNQIPQAECEALVSLHDQTDGANWTTRTGWKLTSTPCDWYGVTCSSGHVVALSLSDNQLRGDFPDLSALTSLAYLSLSDNYLSGPISNLAPLTRLTTLYLSNNQLSGESPTSTPSPT
ncbi:MAG: hypothetical protein HC884_12600, partial [Chloroflexaceae bacterium]|nr:hypothetical protein [Chloroflexaceae bacterium]